MGYFSGNFNSNNAELNMDSCSTPHEFLERNKDPTRERYTSYFCDILAKNVCVLIRQGLKKQLWFLKESPSLK